MKNLFICCLLFSQFALGQSLPVKWTVTVHHDVPGQYLISVAVKIQPGWHVYAEQDALIGLEPLKLTTFPGYVMKVEAAERREPQIYQDPLFDGKQVAVDTGNVEFKRIICVGEKAPNRLTLQLSGFASDNKEIIPINLNQEIELDKDSSSGQAFQHPGLRPAPAVKNSCWESNNDSGLAFMFILGLGSGVLAFLTPCGFPILPLASEYLSSNIPAKKAQHGELISHEWHSEVPLRRVGMLWVVNEPEEMEEQEEQVEGEQSYWLLLGGGILGLFLLSCVPIHIIGGIELGLDKFGSTYTWLNIFFFLVYLYFAFLYVGIFRLPLFQQYNSVSLSVRENISGTIRPALTMVIVSLSFVVLISGFLLTDAISAIHHPWKFTSFMGGFGLALGLPFALMAMFPNWKNNAGKTELIKKSSAYILLAIALKFLSNADLAAQWGLLRREVFIGIWLLISCSLMIYLLGVKARIRAWWRKQLIYKYGVVMSVGQEARRISWQRKFFGMFALLFTLYLGVELVHGWPGRWNILNGLLPPSSYSL